METDYSKIFKSFDEVMPEDIKEALELESQSDLYALDLLSIMKESPCAYAEINGAVFNLIDSENDDLFEYGVDKKITTFSGRDKVLLTYSKVNEMAFVISGNDIDGFYIFKLT